MGWPASGSSSSYSSSPSPPSSSMAAYLWKWGRFHAQRCEPIYRETHQLLLLLLLLRSAAEKSECATFDSPIFFSRRSKFICLIFFLGGGGGWKRYPGEQSTFVYSNTRTDWGRSALNGIWLDAWQRRNEKTVSSGSVTVPLIPSESEDKYPPLKSDWMAC